MPDRGRRYRFVAALYLFSTLLGGCGGGSGNDTPTIADAARAPQNAPASCLLADQRDWLLRYMGENYYWNTRLGQPNARAPGLDGFFRSLLRQPEDRYSYTQTSEDFHQFFGEGRRTGYGYTLVWNDAEPTTLRVRSIEPQSPMAKAGFLRGDRVLSVDGYGPSEVLAGSPPRVVTEGVSRRFLVQPAAGGPAVERRVESANFALTPVPAAKVIDLPTPDGPRRVAYLAYHEFIVASETGLDRAFSDFNRAGATELVLDLRYNGGGSVLFARALASMIGGRRLEDRTFASLRFNAAQSGSDLDLIFTTNIGILPGPVLEGLRRVFVITSGDTASASELVINALWPFMPVILVGETTYGKPYGFSPVEACGTVYNAVVFESFNALGVGGFTGGFLPTCKVADDLDSTWVTPARPDWPPRCTTSATAPARRSHPRVAWPGPRPRLQRQRER